nr:BMC domain-containing protein [uncultured Desulfobulbus sp.]
MEEEKQRFIQEYVPGTQLTLAHVIARPREIVCEHIGIEGNCDAIGILTITPGEAVIIAADIATKAADVGLAFLDRFGGSLVMTGDVASVEAAIDEVRDYVAANLHFTVVPITRS